MTDWIRLLLLTSLIALTYGGTAAAVEMTEAVSASRKDGGVILAWKTDAICGTRAAYGTHPELLNKKAEGALGLYHEVSLADLLHDKVYFVRVGTARHWLAEGRLTISNDGTPSWSVGFDDTKAEPAKAEAEPKPTPRPLPKIVKEGEADTPPPTKVKQETKQPVQPRAPPTQETWGYMPSLQDHYERHGKDFRCTSADDYAAKAWLFLQYAKQKSLPMKWDDSDGTLRIWEPTSRAFAAFNRDGTTKTFFRPNSPTYWSRQPGRLIKPTELPF